MSSSVSICIIFWLVVRKQKINWSFKGGLWWYVVIGYYCENYEGNDVQIIFTIQLKKKIEKKHEEEFQAFQ